MQHEQPDGRHDDAEVRETFAARRRIHHALVIWQVVFVFAFTLIVSATQRSAMRRVFDEAPRGEMPDFDDMGFLGLPPWAVVVFFVVGLAPVIYLLVTWRCPRCRRSFGRTWSPRYCAGCGVQLSD